MSRVLDQDKQLRKIERHRRESAGLPEPTNADEPLGLLWPELRERWTDVRSALRAELAAIDGLEERLEPRRDGDERTAVQRATRLPSFRTQATIGGLSDHYALGYAFDSLAAAHPNAMAAEQLLSAAPDGMVVNPTPTRMLPDPYAVGATLLVLLVDAGGEAMPTLAVPDVAATADELAGLRPFATGD